MPSPSTTHFSLLHVIEDLLGVLGAGVSVAQLLLVNVLNGRRLRRRREGWGIALESQRYLERGVPCACDKEAVRAMAGQALGCRPQAALLAEECPQRCGNPSLEHSWRCKPCHCASSCSATPLVLLSQLTWWDFSGAGCLCGLQGADLPPHSVQGKLAPRSHLCSPAAGEGARCGLASRTQMDRAQGSVPLQGEQLRQQLQAVFRYPQEEVNERHLGTG